MLSQLQGGRERVIAYSSTAMNRAQQRYCVTHKELLAVVVAVKRFKTYLSGRKFLLRTDHASLRWVMRVKDPEGMLARWIATLSTFDFDVEHRAGSKHGNADGLSRIPRRRCTREDCKDCARVSATLAPEHVAVMGVSAEASDGGVSDSGCNWVDGYSVDDIVRWQSEDVHLIPVVAALLSSSEKPGKAGLAELSRESRILFTQWGLISLKGGVLCRTLLPDSSRGEPVHRVVAPTALRRELYRQLHELRTAGHLGFARTLSKLKSRFYWPNMKKDVANWCRFCKSCARAKMPFGKHQAKLRHTLSGHTSARPYCDRFHGAFAEDGSRRRAHPGGFGLFHEMGRVLCAA